MAIVFVVLVVAASAAGARLVVLHARLRTLQAQLVTDALTGAFNRRQLDVALAAAVERRRRTGERASILLIDGDPLADITVLQDKARILAVMKDGEFHRAPPVRGRGMQKLAA